MTLLDAMTRHAGERSTAPAIVLADGPTLDWSTVTGHVDAIADALLGLGVGSEQTVGIALRDGVAMALTFVGAGAVCAAAPLNPSYREPEFAFEIEDLSLAAMIVGTGTAEVPAAVAAATAAGVPIVRVEVEASTTGIAVAVSGDAIGPAQPHRRNGADDVALVLHTSGTTARPKIVPLRHRNLMASAEAIGRTLSLEPNDRCCTVMPLFHIHGLIAGLCAPLAAGGTVICTTGFSAADMPRWLRQHEASWYTAVPTMHQALLERFRSTPGDREGIALRFVRSSSSSLAPTVMEDLEAMFECPVVEAYGMTEAAHQMACNPLPPAARKPGSVGPAAGPEVAIMGDAGRLLGPDEIGEVVIAGPNVMSGYHDNAAANAEAFVDGWFRTGDQGRMDAEGYLYLTGRLKEIINRGGENVSPREIDEVLLEHADVAQAVTFAVDDRRLGEQVAAAVVVRAGATVDERGLREYVADRLAPYKVPRRIVFLDAIPKGPSGKLRRIGLADQLGLADLDAREPAAGHVEPATAAEILMAELWSDVLGRPQIGANDHFLDVGGDSLAAVRLLTRVRDEIDVEVSMLDFFDAPTVAEQGRLIEELLLTEAEA